MAVINTGAQTALFLPKTRMKTPRVVRVPSTEAPVTDDATCREFERVKEQLASDYQDQLNALSDLEPLIYGLAEPEQGWMSEDGARSGDYQPERSCQSSRGPSPRWGSSGSARGPPRRSGGLRRETLWSPHRLPAGCPRGSR